MTLLIILAMWPAASHVVIMLVNFKGDTEWGLSCLQRIQSSIECHWFMVSKAQPYGVLLYICSFFLTPIVAFPVFGILHYLGYD